MELPEGHRVPGRGGEVAGDEEEPLPPPASDGDGVEGNGWTEANASNRPKLSDLYSPTFNTNVSLTAYTLGGGLKVGAPIAGGRQDFFWGGGGHSTASPRSQSALLARRKQSGYRLEWEVLRSLFKRPQRKKAGRELQKPQVRSAGYGSSAWPPSSPSPIKDTPPPGGHRSLAYL